MPDFTLRMFNFPVERLVSPRKRLNGILLPKEVLSILPFEVKSCDQIDENTDCIIFLNYFDDFGFKNEKDLKDYILQNTLYSSFIQSSNDEETAQKITTVLKYLFLAKRFLQILVADDTVFAFHLPFLAEAISDLECSFYLMEGKYFKQSMQTLRNVLELTLLHSYFSLKYLDYNEMEIAINNRYPNLKAMIVFLRNEKLLTDKLEQKYFSLYKLLSASVHSEITKLSVTKNFAHKETFSEWYTAFIDVTMLNTKTILRMIQVGF